MALDDELPDGPAGIAHDSRQPAGVEIVLAAAQRPHAGHDEHAHIILAIVVEVFTAV